MRITRSGTRTGPVLHTQLVFMFRLRPCSRVPLCCISIPCSICVFSRGDFFLRNYFRGGGPVYQAMIGVSCISVFPPLVIPPFFPPFPGPLLPLIPLLLRFSRFLGLFLPLAVFGPSTLGLASPFGMAGGSFSFPCPT